MLGQPSQLVGQPTWGDMTTLFIHHVFVQWSGHGRVVYRAWTGRLIAGFAVLVGLTSLGTTVHPDPGVRGQRLLGIILLVLLAAVFIRGLIASTVRAREDELVVRQLLTTRRWTWSQLKRVSFTTRPVGAAMYMRDVLVVETADGRRRELTEINCKPATEFRESPIESLAQRLEAMRAQAAHANAEG